MSGGVGDLPERLCIET